MASGNKRLGSALIKRAEVPSQSPDDMKVMNPGSERMLNAMTGSMQGTGQRAPMPKPKRQLFRQRYYSRQLSHADSLHGDPYGTNSGRDSSTGGRVR